MTTIILTDLQRALLTAAARRDDGQLPPDLAGKHATRVGQALVKRELAREVEVTDPALAWREEGEQPIGLLITAAGRAAVAVGAAAEPAASPPPTAPELPSAKPPTKSAIVLDLLRRDEGATLAELVAATGWLPHTTRAALTGLRKKGHAIERSTRDNTSCYQLEASA